MANLKVCPFAAAHPNQENSECLGEACACYVKMHKRRLMLAEECRLPDQEFFYRYAGCGLVAQVPWELVRTEDKQKKTEE